MKTSISGGSGVTVMALLLLGTPARAQLEPTPDGTSLNLTFSTFASGFASTSDTDGIGPFGIAFATDGSVLVVDNNDQTGSQALLYQLPANLDNQTAGTPIQNYGDSFGPRGLAQVQANTGYNYYMANNSTLVQIDGSGGKSTGKVIATVATLPSEAVGLAVFPGAVPSANTGHIFVSSTPGNTIYNVNPITGSVVPFASGLSAPDGMTFSPDGAFLYVAQNGNNVIRVFTLANGSSIDILPPGLESGKGGLDGLSIGMGTLVNNIYANFNDGTVWQYGLAGAAHPGWVEIADGGSRGDFVTMDPGLPSGGGYPSLLLDQSDSIVRLDPPGGGFYSSESDYVPTPEPAAMALLAMGGILAGIPAWRRWAKQ